jgi:glycosyltransferase involved in cell wall biosynthesis
MRNLAAKRAKGRYLLFIDADMRLDKHVVEDCVRLMKDYQGVIIPEISLGKGFWARCRTLEKKCYVGDDDIEAARFFVADNFWKVGGWDANMISGEDWDLTKRYRKNNLVTRTKYPIYHYEGSLSLMSSMRKKYYYATQSSRYFSKNKISSFNVILFIFRPAYFRHWKELLKDPVHAFGMVFLKLCEYGAGFVGILKSRYL